MGLFWLRWQAGRLRTFCPHVTPVRSSRISDFSGEMKGKRGQYSILLGDASQAAKLDQASSPSSCVAGTERADLSLHISA